MEEKTFAMELLGDLKRANKRMFIIVISLLILWFSTIGLFVYYICNYGTEVVIEDVETTDSGNACIGDGCNNGVINGESKKSN